MSDSEVEKEQCIREAEQRIREAIEIALEYGQCEGVDHKMWVIDQMLRALSGDQYEALVTPEEGQVDWETGSPP